jgi:hypothetical protein
MKRKKRGKEMQSNGRSCCSDHVQGGSISFSSRSKSSVRGIQGDSIQLVEQRQVTTGLSSSSGESQSLGTDLGKRLIHRGVSERDDADLPSGVTIFAVDPGEETGWACLKRGQLAGGSFPLWYDLEKLLGRAMPTVVVCEDFLLYPGKAQHLYWNRFEAPQVIGVLRFLTHKMNLPLVMQPASQGKSVKVVKVDGFNKHATDALRHALRYAISNSLAKPYHYLRWTEPSTEGDDGLERR